MATKRYSRDRVIDKVCRLLVKQGWVEKSNNRHLRLADPTGKMVVTVPGSPSDHRAVQNWLHQLRRTVGFDVVPA
ncbi:type II toxin-antitoxin system HicA family toxin [Ralstonia pickettii]|uniref:type II toxin-antitoxin system HicA family toxin n=1 Tax=Ralstonia pickettii TaxID=329 RepID=UPI0027148027|nr:type II toxin-antitoxin system HicA family toxin [Ralstonia pickettii]WKZ86260.1 type II toxin-antitoxin system HicA family toxin [Ralstonia pickettii]